MKRIFAVIFLSLILLSVCSCTQNPENTQSSEEEKTVSISSESSQNAENILGGSADHIPELNAWRVQSFLAHPSGKPAICRIGLHRVMEHLVGEYNLTDSSLDTACCLVTCVPSSVFRPGNHFNCRFPRFKCSHLRSLPSHLESGCSHLYFINVL